MAPKTQAPTVPQPTPDGSMDDLTFELGDFVSGKHRATSKIPDQVADLLEDLREAYAAEVKDSKGTVIDAGIVKFRTVTVGTEDAGNTFAKNVRSYSKTVLYPEWSARLSRLSPTTFRVGVGPVKPKPRRRKADKELIGEIVEGGDSAQS